MNNLEIIFYHIVFFLLNAKVQMSILSKNHLHISACFKFHSERNYMPFYFQQVRNKTSLSSSCGKYREFKNYLWTY